MAYDHESLDARRRELTDTYSRAMARLDAMQGAYDVCAATIAAWKAEKPDREGRIYVGDAALMVTLSLAVGEIFADAAEVFEAAEPAIRQTIPETWEGEWSELRDESSATEARRSAILHAHPPGGAWYHNGLSVWLTITARITEGAACQVIQIGERKATVSHYSEQMVPVFKSICPGDPAPLAAE